MEKAIRKLFVSFALARSNSISMKLMTMKVSINCHSKVFLLLRLSQSFFYDCVSVRLHDISLCSQKDFYWDFQSLIAVNLSTSLLLLWEKAYKGQIGTSKKTNG